MTEKIAEGYNTRHKPIELLLKARPTTFNKRVEYARVVLRSECLGTGNRRKILHKRNQVYG